MLKIPFFQQRGQPQPQTNTVGGAVASVVIVTRPFSLRNVAAMLDDVTRYPVVLLATETTIKDAIALGKRLPGDSRVVLLNELQEDYYGDVGNLQGTDIAFVTGEAYIPFDRRYRGVDSILLESFAQELNICANCGVKKFVFRSDILTAAIFCAGALDALTNRHCGENCLIGSGNPNGVAGCESGVHMILPRGGLQTEPLGRHNYLVAETGNEFTPRPAVDIPIVTTVAGLAFQASDTTYFIDQMELIRQLAQKTYVALSESPRGLLFAVALAIVMGTKQITCAQNLLEADGNLSQRVRALAEQANVQIIVQL